MTIVLRNAARVELPSDLRETILGMYVHYGRGGEFIRNYKYKDGIAYLPLNQRKLGQVAHLMGAKLQDERSGGGELSAPFTLNPAFTFRPHQEQPARELLKFTCEQQYSVLKAGCGCGKTVVMTWVAGNLNKKILVLVDMGSLQSQWQEAFRMVWGREAQIIKRTSGTFGDVCIATFQLLHANPELLRQLRKEFGTILLDEFHATAAATRREILFQFDSYYRIGCTATLMKKNFGDEVLTDMVADVSVEMIDEAELKAEVYFHPTGSLFAYNTPEMWGKIQGKLAKDSARNLEIAKVIALNCRAGRKVLAVGITVESLKAVAKILDKIEECRYVIYTGSTTLKQDLALKADLAEGRISAILSSAKFNKGLDCPSLDCLVLAKPGNNEAALVQLVGRILRRVTGKSTPVVYDLVDGGTLAKVFAKNRERWYRKLGHRVVKNP